MKWFHFGDGRGRQRSRVDQISISLLGSLVRLVSHSWLTSLVIFTDSPGHFAPTTSPRIGRTITILTLAR